MIRKIFYFLLGAVLPISSYAFVSQYDLSGFTRSATPTAGALEGGIEVTTFVENIFTYDVTGIKRGGMPGALEGTTVAPITPVECVDTPTFTGQEEFNCYYANNEKDVFENTNGIAPACNVVFDSESTESQINTALNEGDADDVFCFKPHDYGSMDITITDNGTVGDEKWIRLYGSGTSHPESLQEQDQAILRGDFVVNGDYWNIHRMVFDFNYSSTKNVKFDSNAQNVIFNKNLVQKGNHDSGMVFVFGADDLTIQNSVIRLTGWLAGTDHHCIGMGSISEDFHLINNQIYDCAGDNLVTNNGSWQYRMIIENNDMYITELMYCDGQTNTQDNNGDYSAAENAIDIKGGTNTSANAIHIIHNRFWGFKDNDSGCGSSGSGGEVIALNEDDNVSNNGSSDYVLISNNIFTDSRKFFNCPNAAQPSNSPRYISLLGNIFYRNNKQVAGETDAVMVQTTKCDYMEIMWNLFVDATYGWVEPAGSDMDFRCNVLVGALDKIGSVGANVTANYNAQYNTTQWTTSSDDFCDGTAPNCDTNADSGNTTLSYKRKRWTGTEDASIPYAVTSASSPHANQATCVPSNVTNDPLLGVD